MIALLFLVFAFAALLARPHVSGWREAMLFAAVGVAVVLTNITEIASDFHFLNSVTIGSLWAVAAISLAVFLFRAWRGGKLELRVPRFNKWWLCLLLPLPVFAAALLWPPNNFDCMVYHLPRVYEWAQNGSIAHYPTPISRQLYQPPLFEFVLLHFRLLGGPLCAFNLLSACSLVGAGLASSLIAERSTRNPWAGPLAFALVVTLPSGVLQGSNPKNDIFLGFWCLAALQFILDFRATHRAPHLACAVLSMALAVLTKGTAWIMLPAIGLFLVTSVFRARIEMSRMPNLCWIGVAIAGALVTISPHHLRNYATFGNPLGVAAGAGEEQYGNATHGPAVIASNTLRNLAIELQTPWPVINSGIQSFVEIAHHVAHTDIDSPETTWAGTSFDVRPAVRCHEDLVSNPLATVFILFSIVLTFLEGRSRLSPETLWIGGIFVISFLLFCALLRWQPWHSRLHVPIFFVGLTFAVSVVAKSRRSWLMAPVLILAIASASATAWNNESRPLSGFQNTLELPLDRRMFQNNLPLFPDYKEALAEILITHPQSVGLVFRRNEWEFPLWYFINDSLAHIQVSNFASIDPIRPRRSPLSEPDMLLVATVSGGQLPPPTAGDYSLVFVNRSFEVFRNDRFRPYGELLGTSPQKCNLATDYRGKSWFGEEHSGNDHWRWTNGNAELRILPGVTGRRNARVTAQLTSFAIPRKIQIRDEDGTLLWQGTAPSNGRISVSIPHLKLRRAGTTLAFSVDIPGTAAGNGDSRILAFSVLNLEALPECDPQPGVSKHSP